MKTILQPRPPRSGIESAIRAAEAQARRLVKMLAAAGEIESSRAVLQSCFNLGRARLALRQSAQTLQYKKGRVQPCANMRS